MMKNKILFQQIQGPMSSEGEQLLKDKKASTKVREKKKKKNLRY